ADFSWVMPSSTGRRYLGSGQHLGWPLHPSPGASGIGLQQEASRAAMPSGFHHLGEGQATARTLPLPRLGVVPHAMSFKRAFAPEVVAAAGTLAAAPGQGRAGHGVPSHADSAASSRSAASTM